jgi:hypothetical protein
MFSTLRRIVLVAAVLLTFGSVVRADEADAHLFADNPSRAKKDKDQPAIPLVSVSDRLAAQRPRWVG